MKKYAIEFAYDGTEFFGYQIQPNQRTVQGELEKALERIFKEKVETQAAGRTDTGVHANGQVAAFFSPNDRLTEKDLKNALNANLPRDIYIKKVWQADKDFHPRHHAKKRIYHYYICANKQNNIFLRKYVWWFPYELDIELMKKATKYFIGTHDFTAFSKKSEEEKNPVRTISNIRIVEVRKGLILIRVEGISYLRGMVRYMVGGLVRVGTKHWNPEFIEEVLQSKDRSKASGLAPAHGLFLHKVFF